MRPDILSTSRGVDKNGQIFYEHEEATKNNFHAYMFGMCFPNHTQLK